MKLQTAFFKFLFLILIFIWAKSSNAQTKIEVNPTVEYQTIEGWGVSLAWWANLAGGMGQATIDELAGYAVNDLNLNVFRFNIAGGENPNCTEGDHIRKDGGQMPGYRNTAQFDGQGWGVNNLSHDVRQITIMDKIASLRQVKGDIITEVVSYSPPWWMTHSECASGNGLYEANNGATHTNFEVNLKPEFQDDFADYLASVTKNLIDRQKGWNISYIEPFNEPISGYWVKGGAQEGTHLSVDVQAQVLWSLWNSQSTYGIESIGLVAADNSKVPTAISNITDLKNNNFNEYNGISKINTHSYSGTPQEKSALATFAKENGNKPIWQSETGPLSWNLPTGKTDWWIRHYDMAYRLVEDLRNLRSTVWCDWQLMSIDDGWGLVQQTNWDETNPYKLPTLKKTRGFYCRKNVTNFIKVGYKIIDTNNANTLGALSPNKDELVFVVVNKTDIVETYDLNLNEFNVSSFKTYRTSGGDSGAENTSEKTISSVTEKGILSGSTLSYSAPAYSVTTFVINISVTPSVIQNGDYFLKASHSNKFMSVAASSITNGAVIEQWEYLNRDNLKFTLTKDFSGQYTFKPVYTDKLMTVHGASNANGAAINIYSDNKAINQKFKIEDLGNGKYKITPKYASGKALAVSNTGLNDGEDIVLWDYIDANNFKWEFIPVSNIGNIADGEYTVKAVHSNKYMSVTGFSITAGAVLEQWEFINQDNLKFQVTKNAEGYYKIKPKYNSLLVSVDGGASTNGTALNINTAVTDASNQLFYVEKVEQSNGENRYKVSPKYNLNKALAVAGSGTSNGDDVFTLGLYVC